jgi:CRP/FNR family cyclic AMP-dependent transcriptional regulator
MFRRIDRHASSRRVDTLRGMAAFQGMPEDLLRRLDALLYETVLPSGTEIMIEGRSADQAFVIADGTAEVSVGNRVVAYISSGDLAGEVGLLDDLPRSATVRAVTPLRVFVMGPRQFRALFDDSRFGLWVAGNLAKRLRSANSRISTSAPAQLFG